MAPGRVTEIVRPLGSGKSTSVVKDLVPLGPVLLLNPNVATVRGLYEWHSGQGGYSVAAAAGHGEGKFVLTNSQGGLKSSDLVIMTYEAADLRVFGKTRWMKRFKVICIDESHETSAWSQSFPAGLILPPVLSDTRIVRLTATPEGAVFDPANYSTKFPVEVVPFRGQAELEVPLPRTSRIHFVSTLARAESVQTYYQNNGVSARTCTSQNKQESVEWFGDGEDLKVLVATNTIRSGITLNVGEEVDEGEEVTVRIDATGTEVTTRGPTTAWSSMQRFGRVGRLKSGVYWYNVEAGTGGSGERDWNNLVRSACLNWAFYSLHGFQMESALPEKKDLVSTIIQLILAGVPPLEAYKSSEKFGFCWDVYADLKPLLDPSLPVNAAALLPSGEPTDDSVFVGDYLNPSTLKRRDGFSVLSVMSMFGFFVFVRIMRFFLGDAVVVEVIPVRKIWDSTFPKLNIDLAKTTELYDGMPAQAKRILQRIYTRFDGKFSLEHLNPGLVDALYVFTMPFLTFCFGLLSTIFMHENTVFTFGLGLVVWSLDSFRPVEGDWRAWSLAHTTLLMGVGFILSAMYAKFYGTVKPQLSEEERFKRASAHLISSPPTMIAVAGILTIVVCYLWVALGDPPSEVKDLVGFVSVFINSGSHTLVQSIFLLFRGLFLCLADFAHFVVEGADETAKKQLLSSLSEHWLLVSGNAYTFYLFLFNTFNLYRPVAELLVGYASGLGLVYHFIYNRLQQLKQKTIVKNMNRFGDAKVKYSIAAFVGSVMAGFSTAVFTSLRHYGNLDLLSTWVLANAKNPDSQLSHYMTVAGFTVERIAPDPTILFQIANGLRFVVAPFVSYVCNYATVEFQAGFAFNSMLYITLQTSWADPMLVLIGWATCVLVYRVDAPVVAYLVQVVMTAGGAFSAFAGKGIAVRDGNGSDPRASNVLAKTSAFQMCEVTVNNTRIGRTDFDWNSPVPGKIEWLEVAAWTKRYAEKLGFEGLRDSWLKDLVDFPLPSLDARLHYGSNHVIMGHSAVFPLNRSTVGSVGKFAQVGLIRPLSNPKVMFVVGLDYDVHRRGGFPTRLASKFREYPRGDLVNDFDFFYRHRLVSTVTTSFEPSLRNSELVGLRRTLVASAFAILDRIHNPESRMVAKWVLSQLENSFRESGTFLNEVTTRFGPVFAERVSHETDTFKVLGRTKPLKRSKPHFTAENPYVGKLFEGVPAYVNRAPGMRSYTDNAALDAGIFKRFARPLRFICFPKTLERAIRWHYRDIGRTPFTRQEDFVFNHRTGPGLLQPRKFDGPAISHVDDLDFWAAGLNPVAGREAFAKNEKLVKPQIGVDRAKFLPRTIVMLGGPERYVNHLFSGIAKWVYNLPTSGVGKDPFAISRWLGRCSEKGWSFVSVDTEKWDTSQSIATRLLWWRAVWRMNPDVRLARFFCDSIWNFTITHSGMLMSSQAPTNTGDWDTTASNTYINSVAMVSTIMATFGVNLIDVGLLEVQAVGDDIIVSGPRHFLEMLQPMIVKTYALFGFKVDEFSVIKDNIVDVRFCSHGAAKVGGSYMPIRSADVVLSRLSICGRQPRQELMDLAASYYLLYNAIPHVREMCAQILRVADYVVLEEKTIGRLTGFENFEQLVVEGDILRQLDDALDKLAGQHGGDIDTSVQRHLGYDWDWSLVVRKVRGVLRLKLETRSW